MTRVAPDFDMPPGEPSRSLSFSLNGGVEACSEARRAILAGDGAVPASARDDILLLVSELVTNAVRHGDVGPDGSVRVELRRRPQHVRVEVLHPGRGFEHQAVPPPSGTGSGWGLVLVDRIADRWGIDSAEGLTRVWFELPSA
jgi:anti-sigma regulatory factor (Ser/Thr protein kinase)